MSIIQDLKVVGEEGMQYILVFKSLTVVLVLKTSNGYDTIVEISLETRDENRRERDTLLRESNIMFSTKIFGTKLAMSIPKPLNNNFLFPGVRIHNNNAVCKTLRVLGLV